MERPCDVFPPEKINAKLWTHINFAFALVGNDNRIAAMNSYDAALYPRVTGLKAHNPALKVFIAVGGWAAGGASFSRMVATPASRATFISSALSFMKTYGFDGIDIDWEYPMALDREGNPDDAANLVTFCRELRAALGSSYGITLTLPSSYCKMPISQPGAWSISDDTRVSTRFRCGGHGTLSGLGTSLCPAYPQINPNLLQQYNFMSYDIHGTWDGNSPYTQAIVQPHTNLTGKSRRFVSMFSC